MMQTLEKIELHTAGLLVIQDNKLLLAFSKNKKAFYLPGGKIDQGETSQEAIIREIKEELNIDLIPEKLKFHYHISAPAYGENANIVMEQDCYLYDLDEKIQPSNEIAEVKFFDFESYQKEEIQVVGVQKAFEKLRIDKFLI
jgi:8-oxo-dGTP pyrophosphatase MutT (NUDIX family)